jgi:hypothetical protein
MIRVLRVLLLFVLLMTFAGPAQAANPEKRLSGLLGDLWTQVIETPTPRNPFTGGDFCVRLAEPAHVRIVVPFAPTSTTTVHCTVPSGTMLFISAWSSECSNVEPEPYFGRGEADLRSCARAADSRINPPVVTLDGRTVPVQEVETALLKAVLPADNIFDQRPRTRAQSVGHGWVALLRPLPPGTHTIILRTTGIDVSDAPVHLVNTTTIVVQRGSGPH